jgi:membrane-associated phospholipid phosphatase
VLATTATWTGLLAVIAAAVWVGAFRAVDESALELARTLNVPAVDVVSSAIGLLGQLAVAVGIALGLAAARYRTRSHDALVPLAIVVVIAIESLLKIAVPQLPPPPDEARSVSLIPLVQSPFAYAFPSGNVARAAFLLRIAHSIPTWVVAGGIAAMAVTRIYLGEHWLSDTIGGAILGIGVATVARRIA